MIASGKPHHLPIWSVLLALGAAFADPMPYDSIGNPLNLLPATNPNIQRMGDSLNMTLSRVRVNQAGYRKMDVVAGYAKFYCVGCAGGTFNVVNSAGALVGTGTLTPKGVTVSGQITEYASNSAEHTYNGDGDWKPGYPMVGKTTSGALAQGILPATLPVGKYTIRVGSDSSAPFVVSDNVYGMARDAALKFFGVARSGDYQSWFHPASHLWDGWLYDSAAKNPDGTYKYKGALKGGWYDCGNHLKEARTNSFPLAALGMLATTMREKDADRYGLNQNLTLNTDRIPDVLRETWVGAQYVFSSWRLAKGKASDMFLSLGKLSNDFAWWGRPENHDGVLTKGLGGRKERFLVKDWGSASMADFAAGLAFLSRQYRPYDAAFADSALVIAKAMYDQAMVSNKMEGSADYVADQVAFDDLGLAAVALLWATGDSKYLKDAFYTTGLPDGVGGVCKSTAMAPDKASRLFAAGFFACDADAGMQKKGGPTDYSSAHNFALYSLAKLILVNADTAAHYGISAATRDTFLLRTITQLSSPLWGSSPGPAILIPTGDQYNPTRLTYDSIWYSMGIGYGKTGWWNKYQFGNLADLYMFYDATSLVDGRAILDKPGNTDWKRKEVLQVLLGGLNYMFGTNALDLSYLFGIGRKNPMHPHHRAANPEGRNVPGAYYNYTIPVGGLFGGLMTGPANSEALVEKWGDYRQSEANCPDAQAAVMIPLMGLSRETPVAAPKAIVKVLYTSDTAATIQIDLDKWGSVKLGYGTDSAVGLQTIFVAGSDTGGTFKIVVGGLTPATQYFFHVVATDLGGLVSTTSKWPNGQSDSVPYTFITKARPPVPPQYGNIKACNITSDSAEVMWYTPNGEYLSSVKFADSVSWKAGKFSYVDTDAVGDVQVKFHRVKLMGLKSKTTYYFQVGVPGSYDAVVGCFRTPGEDVKFDIRTTHYTWDGHPAMGIAVINQDVKSYDSLSIRLYVNGTRANILDLAARVDIAFAYMSAGYTDTGLFAYTKDVQRSRPQLIDPTCPAATQSCAWYFDLPMYGAVMQSQARWRLDVVFDRHNLIRDSTEILNMAPTHDPFAVGSQDWSMRAHVAGADNGLSPVDYPGVPLGSKNAIDSMAQYLPVNPYIAVFRRNEFVYGFSPYAAEQATKRVVYGMNVAFEKPFDVPGGNTIQLGTGDATRLKGTLDPYDIMMPAVKGHITSVWVNGVALSDADRKAALTRQADGTWKVDLPLRLAGGTNKVDVTFFAGSDSTETVTTGTCTESRGCAFYNASWYVNYVSNLTPSVLTVVDATNQSLGLVTPDSSSVAIWVRDGNANLAKTAFDSVKVTVTNLRTGSVTILVLPETGANNGIFLTKGMVQVSITATVGRLQMLPGDTLLVKYVDAADPTDSSSARIWSKSSWAGIARAGIFAYCGSGMSVDVLLDRSLLAAGQAAPSALGSVGVTLRRASGDSLTISPVAGGWSVTGANFDHVRIPLPASVTLHPDWTGAVLLGVPDGQGGFKLVAGSITDSIGPWIDSTKIVENLSGNPFDTLYLWTSETTKPLGATLPVLLTRNGIPVATTGLAVNGAPLLDAATGRWTYVVTAGVIKAQDSLRWNPGLVSDPKGNPALDCPFLLRPVRLVSRPAPFTRAWLKDIDGDGRGDQITMVFLKQLVASDLPDSIRVAFGPANTLRSSAVDLSMVTGSVLTVPLADPFAVTETRGSAVDGSGKLDLWKSGEASGPFSLVDSVGPNLLSAKLRFGSIGSATDSLELEFSEPVRRTAGTGWLVLQPASELGTAGVPDSLSPLLWKLPVDTGTVVAGDLVRPVPTGKWVDALTGNEVGIAHAWIPVQGGERGPIGGWFQDTNGDGSVDLAVVQFSKTPKTRSSMNLLWPSRTGFDSTRIDSGAWTLDPDGLTATIAVGPFAKGVTSTPVSQLGRWISGGLTSQFPMADHVAPVIVSATVRYASADGLPDTLKVRWSEPLDWATGPVVFHDNEAKGVASENVTYKSGELEPGGFGAWLLIDSTTTVLQRGDSARIAPTVGDAFGNLAGAVTVRVPVTFGLRPPRLDFKLYNFVEYDGIWPLGTGAPFQTWIRQRGDAWQLPDGTAPQDVTDAHFLGMELTLNQFLDGYAYIYDNSGAFVAKADFAPLRQMVEQGRFQADGSGTYQIRLAWDGRTITGSQVSSGVYYMRMILKFQLENADRPLILNRVYTLGFKRSVK